MHRLVLGVIALFTLGSGAPTAAGQDMTPVGSPVAVTCLAPSAGVRDAVDHHGTPGVEETGTAPRRRLAMKRRSRRRTPPPGTPAGTAVLDRIRHG